MNIARHQLSALFAQFDLGEAELDNLAADIAEHGQQEPIRLYEGKILDGWNRYQACKVAKVDPITVEWEGTDPWAYVVSINIARRHMTPAQIAAVYLQKEAMENAPRAPNGALDTSVGDKESATRKKKHSERKLAQELGVSKGTAHRLAKVANDASPEVKRAVIKGELSLDAAAKVSSLPQEEQQKATRPEPAPKLTSEQQLMQDALGDFDPIEELEKAQNELIVALKKIETLSSDDLAKELATQIDLNNALQSRLHQEMAKNAALDKEVRRFGKQHAEIRKALGTDDDRKIVALIKSMKSIVDLSKEKE